ncbi:unnamed protein product [Rhizophagus irregularis]|nr:unnamed protein product [Rhizophagus irregularis]CAB5361143.1 unnamed protein product [Rhizophagus irregularis]
MTLQIKCNIIFWIKSAKIKSIKDQEQEHRITRDVGDTSVTQTQNEATSFWQIVEGIKNCLAQNKEIF